jgi:DNA ligase (NAD+)
VTDVGPEVSRHVHTFFRQSHNRAIIDRLLQAGIHWPAIEPTRNQQSLSGQTFVITGTLASLTREEAKQRIKALGGKVTTQVSGSTTHLIVGESPGSKLREAQNLDIPILSEQQFIDILQS